MSKDRTKENLKKLRAAGIPESMITGYGSKLSQTETRKIMEAWTAQQQAEKQAAAALEARTPDFLKNDPAFQALSADMKEIAIYNYEVQKANDVDKANKLSAALEQATAMADPYWKNVIRIAQDEVLRNFEAAEGDYESSLQRQQKRIEEINEDLVSNKEFLTLEQQNELANLSRTYQLSYENLVQGAADRGLTFSTKRQLAQQRLAEENQGMVESTQRQYNKQLTDLQKEASRGTGEAQQEIEDLQRRMKESTTSMGRGAETYLGTENLPTLPGYAPLGEVSGDLYEQKVKDIEARKQTLYNELTQSSLNI